MNLLKTAFYDEFACIGAECPLTCCGGWMIAMEEKTLKDYRMMGGDVYKRQMQELQAVQISFYCRRFLMTLKK